MAIVVAGVHVFCRLIASSDDVLSVQGWITHSVGSAHSSHLISSPMANGTDDDNVDVLCRLEAVPSCGGWMERLCKAANKQSVSSFLRVVWKLE